MKRWPIALFVGAAFGEVLNGHGQSAGMRKAIERELARKGEKGRSEDWSLFESKVGIFRPRIVGAVAAYATLAGVPYREIRGNGGLTLFRAMWFLASAQDDLIDEIGRHHGTPEEIRHTVRQAIFGHDRALYRAAFCNFVAELRQPEYSPEAKRHLAGKAHTWYRTLYELEEEALPRRLDQLPFDYCRSYRERQAQAISGLMIACLSGRRCRDLGCVGLEWDLAFLSYRTQVFEDISDLPEDIRMARPSFALGALVDHPEELRRVRRYIAERRIGKVTPRLLRKLAPESYKLLRSVYEEYGHELRHSGKGGALLAFVGDVLFRAFPVFRDTVYRVNPRLANF